MLTFTIGDDEVHYCVETSLWARETGFTGPLGEESIPAPHLYTAVSSRTLDKNDVKPEDFDTSLMETQIKRLRKRNEISEETEKDLTTELKMLETIREVRSPPARNKKEKKN